MLSPEVELIFMNVMIVEVWLWCWGIHCFLVLCFSDFFSATIVYAFGGRLRRTMRKVSAAKCPTGVFPRSTLLTAREENIWVKSVQQNAVLFLCSLLETVIIVIDNDVAAGLTLLINHKIIPMQLMNYNHNSQGVHGTNKFFRSLCTRR